MPPACSGGHADIKRIVGRKQTAWVASRQPDVFTVHEGTAAVVCNSRSDWGADRPRTGEPHTQPTCTGYTRHGGDMAALAKTAARVATTPTSVTACAAPVRADALAFRLPKAPEHGETRGCFFLREVSNAMWRVAAAALRASAAPGSTAPWRAGQCALSDAEVKVERVCMVAYAHATFARKPSAGSAW